MDGSRRFRLGLLALLAIGAFVGMLGFVLQGVLRQNRVSYFILFEENVKGMVIGSKVNFQGVPFGMVKDIRFQNGKTMVELSVDPSRAEIQDITRARLDRLLVTGQVTVELEGYGPEGKALQPGMFVQPKADPIHQLTATLPEIVPQITGVLERLTTMLDRTNALLEDGNRQRFNSILEHVDTITAQLPPSMQRADALMQQAQTTLAALDRAAAMATDDLMPAGRSALAQTQAALADLHGLQGTLADAAHEAKAMFGGLRAPALAALSSLRGSLDELRSCARQLRLAPDSLLFGVARPAAPVGGDR